MGFPIIRTTVFISAAFLGGIGQAETFNDLDQSINCMAMNVYHEARGEDIIGMAAVAHVTLNRVEHNYFPDNICDVVWDDGQFSWTQDGRSDATNNHRLWIESINVAMMVIEGEIEDPTEGALFYHANYIEPPFWVDNMEIALDHGIHIFYHWDGFW